MVEFALHLQILIETQYEDMCMHVLCILELMVILSCGWTTMRL